MLFSQIVRLGRLPVSLIRPSAGLAQVCSCSLPAKLSCLLRLAKGILDEVTMSDSTCTVELYLEAQANALCPVRLVKLLRPAAFVGLLLESPTASPQCSHCSLSLKT